MKTCAERSGNEWFVGDPVEMMGLLKQLVLLAWRHMRAQDPDPCLLNPATPQVSLPMLIQQGCLRCAQQIQKPTPLRRA